MEEIPFRYRVLVVDDNQDAAELLQMLLQLHDYEVRVALDGSAGLTIASDFIPHVTCSDLHMPVMSGFELATELRKIDWGFSPYIIAITGLNTHESYHHAIDSGFDVCLSKPLLFKQLITHMEKFLKKLEIN